MTVSYYSNILNLENLKKDLKKTSDPQRAVVSQRFFKTGKGQYGYGDIFLGITVPDTRKVAKQYKDLPFGKVKKLLASRIHEERLVALLILVHNFQTSDKRKQKEIVDFYLAHTKFVNNWDLVDLSADKILGAYLLETHGRSSKKAHSILEKLAKSDSIWEKRIAIVSTYQYIKTGESRPTLAIAELLLRDSHDLIHKAVGWMLREVGKRCSEDVLEDFLKKHYKTMPRAMLRYAIERFPEEKRKMYLCNRV